MSAGGKEVLHQAGFGVVQKVRRLVSDTQATTMAGQVFGTST